MPSISITIKNLPQIKAAFSKSPMLMARNLNTAIKKTITSIEARSRQNTPFRTGRLRASTYTTFSSLRGEVGTNTEYDIYVHFGTRYMRARPYLSNAVESNEVMTNKFFHDAVQDTLNEIARAT